MVIKHFAGSQKYSKRSAVFNFKMGKNEAMVASKVLFNI